MIVGMKILDDFEIGDAKELVEQLRERNLLNITLEQIKKIVKKEWDGSADWDDLTIDSECIDYILKDLANGCFYWEYNDDSEQFTIYVVDPDNPFTKEGKIPKFKEIVAFT